MTQADIAAARMEPASRPGRKRDHSRDPEILEAAIEVLAETGYEGMTVDMVAARAKAGKATLYRRWPSKADLVVDAVACMSTPSATNPPDTGTLRGDLIAVISLRTVEDGERKLRVLLGLASVLARSPELAETIRAAFVEPRVEVTKALFQQAVDRGEVSADHDFDLLARVSTAMVIERALLQHKPIDRRFLISVIDGVLLPAVGLPSGNGR
jgi:AcrR family transcriptional regulator